MATILIVDDNKRNLQVLGSILGQAEYKVAMALDGQTALKLAGQLLPDIIVLDIMMPEMDGFEVCEKLKADNQLKEIPVIFLTAKVDVDDIVKGFNVGGSDYVTKPFKKQEMLVRISSQIELVENRKKIKKQAEELAQLNALKDKVFEVIAFDIKHAMDSFIAVPKLMADPRLDLSTDEINELMGDLQDKAKNTYRLLENIIWWSRSQQNLISPKYSRVQLFKIIGGILDEFSDMCNEKELVIKNSIDGDASVFTDKKFLEVILKNILHNAIKYSCKKCDIQFNSYQSDDSYCIEITNSGQEISSEILDKIGEASSYVAEYGTNSEKGAGIGLKVCLSLLDSMNGKLVFERKNNKTVVTIKLANES